MTQYLHQGDVDAMRRKMMTALDIRRTERVAREGSWDQYEGIPQIQRLLKPIFLRIKIGVKER